LLGLCVVRLLRLLAAVEVGHRRRRRGVREERRERVHRPRRGRRVRVHAIRVHSVRRVRAGKSSCGNTSTPKDTPSTPPVVSFRNSLTCFFLQFRDPLFLFPRRLEVAARHRRQVRQIEKRLGDFVFVLALRGFRLGLLFRFRF
jgi:hypothetical protein